METVDMSRYVLSGAGANGESYDSLDDEGIMLKLYNASYPSQPVIDELETARKVYELGVPSPEPGELVEVNGRLGIRFRRVIGKRSYSRAVSEEPERVDEFAREFARYGRKLHSIHCPADRFMSAKDQYLVLLDADRSLTEEEHALMRSFILSMPEADTAVHGDFHMGNLLTTLPEGAAMDEPHDVLFIDLGYFGYGNPLVDIGMLHNICRVADEDFVRKEMHMSRELAGKFWESFVDEYFFSEDRIGEKWFGAGVTAEDIDTKMLPYTAVKMLLVGFNLGTMPDVYLELIRKALPMMG